MQTTPVVQRVSREQAEQAAGIVIVIDVMRAFTVAANAFAGGATSLWLVRSVEDAQALRELDPAALLAGEIGGRLIRGFDLNNSPYLMARANVRGKRIIQRTGAGTQGAVRARNAVHLLAASLTNARATACYATRLSAATSLPITFLPTEPNSGNIPRNEDNYCADYLEALITQPETAADVLNERIARLYAEGRFHHWGEDNDEDFPQEDIEYVLAVNCFDFAMVGTRAQLEPRDERAAPVQYIELQAINIDCDLP